MSVANRRSIAGRWIVFLAAVLSTACGKLPSPSTAHAATVTVPSSSTTASGRKTSQFRLNGTVHAVHVFAVQVPQITGQGGRITLTRLVPNGSRVQKDGLLVEFDRTQQLDNAREAQAKFDDLGHQVDQKRAQNLSEEEKRSDELQKAEADLARARIQLRKGQLLSEIDRLKSEAKLEDAEAHVASLKKSGHFHELASAAALRILELQRDRQKVQLERALNNAARLQLRAPLAGMVALENVWRNGSMGHAQEGDQLWSGQVLLRIFDPSEMSIHALVGEPDGALLSPGKRVQVRLDAYPDLIFPARFESASPVASSALGSPIKTFAARFRLETSDPHLLPDLSAAVILEPEAR